jgi:uncharacterized circularly permuted ATP-grasp superfamily protein/uncharacterized alpha-E superfamily protein
MKELMEPWFRNYFSNGSYDEMLTPAMEVNPNWSALLANIKDIGIEGLVARQYDLDWYLSENGVTYNVYNDPQGLNRPWRLNVLPLIIHNQEWIRIEKGIKQRTELLNLIIKDVYGKRELISNGLIPQEVIYGHWGFLRQCDQIHYNTSKHLLIHAIDIARGPDGRMWVISDRTQAPSGMGYALENRLTMGRVMPDLFKNMYVKKLSVFFQHFSELLISSGPQKKDAPNIVILSPGPHNETYFEHAYLASFLGYPLVQGNDLIVREGYLWMKSLKGLKQVDVVLRRVDDVYTDPLELKEDSQLGVAGLLDVIRRQHVTVINPVGCRILENPGLIPFMQGIARYFLNEELILPQIATWWCGQENEKKYVLEHMSGLIIKRIDRSSPASIFFGDRMTRSALDDLRRQISDRPYRFVAQEKIGFSTTPTFLNQQFEPRNSVWRTFSIAHRDEYSVMPGGLVRVAVERGDITVSNQKGGTNKDIWILDQAEEPTTGTATWNRKSSVSVSGLDDLPSHTAENLYWAGRYVGRTLTVARFIRMVLKQMTYLQFDERKPNSQSLQLLFQAVTHLTGTYPGFIPQEEEDHHPDPYTEMLSVLMDKERPGSLSYTLAMFTNVYYSIRNLWSADMWRVFDRIGRIWKTLQADPEVDIRKIIQALDQLITRLIAFMGLVEESILIEQGLLLYFIGLQLEQSILNISKCRALLIIKQNDQVEYEVLESLLTSHESLNIYRYSYRTFITLENLIDLIILDPKYPRSLTYQLNRLNKDLAILPQAKNSHELTDYEKYVFEAYSKVRLAKSDALIQLAEDSIVRDRLDNLLFDISELLNNASIALTNTYFSHIFTQNQLVTQILPV